MDPNIIIYLVGVLCVLLAGGIYIRVTRSRMLRAKSSDGDIYDMSVGTAMGTFWIAIAWPLVAAVVVPVGIIVTLITITILVIGGISPRDFYTTTRKRHHR